MSAYPTSPNDLPPAATVDSHGYRTAPSQTEAGMPSGVPYIIGNEAAERFSFYGMRSILVIFMTQYLIVHAGTQDHLSDGEARKYYSDFNSAVYAMPILGSFLAETFLGKYQTIFWLSIVYCLGHFALAVRDTPAGLVIGLSLISLGSGGIKPCVSANVGDQFGSSNKHLITRIFAWFYFSINAGSFISNMVCPVLLNNPRFGPSWAFGLPGVAMVVATVFFWLGRRKYVHVPPGGLESLKESFRGESLRALGRIATIFVFIPVFWSLYDQSGGGLTLQCKKMDLSFLGYTLLPEQVQSVNPILILLFIPLANYVLYPALGRLFVLTPLRKIGLGLLLTAASFLVIAHIQTLIDAGGRPTVWWQIFAYTILTLGEVMVSITGLEFSYTQAPNKLKSVIMAAWLLTVSVGNQLTARINAVILNSDGSTKMSDYHYYLLFAGLMAATTVVYVIVAGRYQGKTYIQGSDVAEADLASTASVPA